MTAPVRLLEGDASADVSSSGAVPVVCGPLHQPRIVVRVLGLLWPSTPKPLGTRRETIR